MLFVQTLLKWIFRWSFNWILSKKNPLQHRCCFFSSKIKIKHFPVQSLKLLECATNSHKIIKWKKKNSTETNYRKNAVQVYISNKMLQICHGHTLMKNFYEFSRTRSHFLLCCHCNLYIDSSIHCCRFFVVAFCAILSLTSIPTHNYLHKLASSFHIFFNVCSLFICLLFICRRTFYSFCLCEKIAWSFAIFFFFFG